MAVTWIKLNLDMFDNKKIKQIRKMPGGNDMVLFWVMLLTLAGKSNSQGYILFTESIPYTPEMLANECDMELNTIKMALDLFSRFNMISISEDVITITSWSEHQNIEGMERAKLLANERVKRHREKKKKLIEAAKEEICGDSCNVTETLQEPLCNGDEMHIKKRERENIENKNIERENIEKEDISLYEKSLELCKYYEQLKPGENIASQLPALKIWIKDYGFDWTKEAIQLCVSDKGRFIAPWIKKVLMNWQTEGHESNKSPETKKESNEPKVSGWNHYKKFN